MRLSAASRLLSRELIRLRYKHTFYICMTTTTQPDVTTRTSPRARNASLKEGFLMNSKYLLLVFPALTISVFAANQPVVAYTFECKNPTFQAEGSCPQGGRPGALILGRMESFMALPNCRRKGAQHRMAANCFCYGVGGIYFAAHVSCGQRLSRR